MRTLLFALALSSCAHSPQPAPNPDAASPVTCASVCEHAAALVLKCSWAQPTKLGHSCEAVCLNAKNAGQSWALECIQRQLNLGSCDTALACQ